MVNPETGVIREHEIQLRVRYQETDAQGRVHHANYINYFEVARIEMLRASGVSYREFEDSGLMLVVTKMECQYFAGAIYDDLLTIQTKVTRAKGVRIEHEYTVTRGEELVVKGKSTIACVSKDGKVARLPKWLRD